MDEHGDYEILTSNFIIITRAKGPWNEESTSHFAQEMQYTIDKFNGMPFAAIGMFYGESILTPDAENQLAKLNRWRKERGLQIVAIVLSDKSMGNSLTIHQYKNAYASLGIKHQFFEHISQAKKWLEFHGFYA